VVAEGDGLVPTTYKTQAHTSSVSPDMNYFYSAASHDGVFFEIDVETLAISRELDIENELKYELELENYDVNILMGSFIWDGEGDGM
jgi:hypothetical protein